jgi:sterol desaturase/sphingolipid hydroxylase (fatty acid hydroxylase superfamily)
LAAWPPFVNGAAGNLDLLRNSAPILGAFLLIAAVEMVRPWRPEPTFSALRWFSSLAVFALAAGFDYLAAPVVAMVTPGEPIAAIPLWLQLAAGIPALDALGYGLHRAFHAIPLLWRFHALHHADAELDVSTTVRHHPAETLMMTVAVGGVGGIAGLSPLVIGIYGSISLCVQFFSHANVALPRRLARALGWLVVTPDLHRVHHSRHQADFNKNFSLIFPVWDRLFATCRGEPKLGEDRVEFGVDQLREPYYQRLDRMLWLPFYARGNL